MNRPKDWHHWMRNCCPWCLLPIVLTGCAVLTVDVDVYKGPLASERETQLAQLTSIMASSRILFVDLFNTLKINKEYSKTESLRVELSGDKLVLYRGCLKIQPPFPTPLDLYSTSKAGRDLNEARTASFILYILNRYTDTEVPKETGTASTEEEPGNASTKSLQSLATAAQAALHPSATANGSTPAWNDEKKLKEYFSAMSVFAHELLTISDFGSVPQQGIFLRLWDAMKSTGRNQGQSTSRDVMMVTQAIGNTILAATDEYFHAINWEAENHKRALEDLVAIQSNLYGEGAGYLCFWQLLAEQKAGREQAADRPIAAAQWTKIAKQIGVIRQDTAQLGSPHLAADKAKDAILTSLKDSSDLKELADAAFTFSRGAPPLSLLESNTLRRADITGAALSTLRAYRLRLLLDPEVKAPASGTLSEAESVKRVDAAISQIEDRRAEAIPLRPAGAFLRTTYPINSFQENSSLTAGNMMGPLLVEALPFVGAPIRSISERIRDPHRNRRLEESLDYSFWLPINQIKVQGTGRVNYVVTKDDVGNWYVKNYAADNDTAFKTLSRVLTAYYVPAKGLALRAKNAAGDAASPVATAPDPQLVEAVKTAAAQDAIAHQKLYDDLQTTLESLPGDKPDAQGAKYKDAVVKISAESGTTLPSKVARLLPLAKDYTGERWLATLVQQNAKAIALQTVTEASRVRQAAYKMMLAAPTATAAQATDKAHAAALAEFTAATEAVQKATVARDKAEKGSQAATEAEADLKKAQEDLTRKTTGRDNALKAHETAIRTSNLPDLITAYDEQTKAAEDVEKAKTTSADATAAANAAKTAREALKQAIAKYIKARGDQLAARETDVRDKLLASIPTS